jgi:hypothetical protein
MLQIQQLTCANCWIPRNTACPWHAARKQAIENQSVFHNGMTIAACSVRPAFQGRACQRSASKQNAANKAIGCAPLSRPGALAGLKSSASPLFPEAYRR